MKKSYIKESFDRYIDLLVKKSFGVHQINEFIVPAAIGYGINKFVDKNKDKIKNAARSARKSLIPANFKDEGMSGGRKISPNFKGDAMSGGGKTFKLPHIPSEHKAKMHQLPHKIDAFPFRMKEYKTEFESSKNIESFLSILQGMDDFRMKKNIDILADTMISAPQNTQANRDFERKYKQKGITTKEQLAQAIYKEVMDRKNYRPDLNM